MGVVIGGDGMCLMVACDQYMLISDVHVTGHVLITGVHVTGSCS